MSATQRLIEHINPGPVPITLCIGTGRIKVSTTSSRATAAVRLAVPPQSPAAAALAAVTIARTDDRLTVETPIVTTAAAAPAAQITDPAAVVARDPSTDSEPVSAADVRLIYRQVGTEAIVPEGSSVYARTDGPIVTEGPLAHLEALTTGKFGTVRVAHADRADITTTAAADVSVDSAGELTVVTGTGNVLAHVAGAASVTVARRGNIVLHVRAAAHITAATMDGDITVYTHVDGVTTELHAENGTARIVTTH